MKQYNIQPNIETYKILLSDASSLEFTQKIEQELQDKKCKDNTDVCVQVLLDSEKFHFEMAINTFRNYNVYDDITLWNVALYACAINGRADVAHLLLQEMVSHVKPTANEYRLILSACGYQENVNLAEQVYEMAKNNINIPEFLDRAMIDVYARSGHLDKAEKWARGIKKQKVVAWVTVLAGCKKYNDIERMERIRDEYSFLQKSPISQLLMANIAAHAGKTIVA